VDYRCFGNWSRDGLLIDIVNKDPLGQWASSQFSAARASTCSGTVS
jgi:hypothetical protein